jgi:hypothetical protein
LSPKIDRGTPWRACRYAPTTSARDPIRDAARPRYQLTERPMFGGQRLSRLGVFSPEFPDAEALIPLVSDNPDCARHIAEGAVMRLLCGEQCFETYRAHLWAHVHPVVYAAE